MSREQQVLCLGSLPKRCQRGMIVLLAILLVHMNCNKQTTNITYIYPLLFAELGPCPGGCGGGPGNKQGRRQDD